MKGNLILIWKYAFLNIYLHLLIYTFLYSLYQGESYLNDVISGLENTRYFMQDIENVYQQCLNLEDANEQETCASNLSITAKFFNSVFIYSAQRFYGTLTVEFDRIINNVEGYVSSSKQNFHFWGSLIVDQSLECIVLALNEQL